MEMEERSDCPKNAVLSKVFLDSPNSSSPGSRRKATGAAVASSDTENACFDPLASRCSL